MTQPLAICSKGRLFENMPILDALPAMVAIIRRSDRRIVNANARARTAFGPDAEAAFAAEGLNLLVEPADWPNALQRLEHAGAPTEFQTLIRLPGGSQALLSGYATLVACDGEDFVIVTFWDTTEREEMNRRLRQVKKLEALRRISGGLAHELNNALVPIITFAELAAGATRDGTVRHHLDRVLAAANRSADLVTQLLEFSHAKPSARESVDLAALMRRVVDLLKASAPPRIKFQVVVDSDSLPPVFADPTLIEEALLNLGMNAVDAVSENTGRVQVRSRQAVLDNRHNADSAGIRPGRYVAVSISDNGAGMSADVLERIFDPFFTTKPIRPNVGLGLSVVHGIVTELGGSIDVQSRPGAGTTVTMWLPAADGASFD